MSGDPRVAFVHNLVTAEEADELRERANDVGLKQVWCCSVLQCGAVCCSVVQCVAVCCSVLQCGAVCCSET